MAAPSGPLDALLAAAASLAAPAGPMLLSPRDVRRLAAELEAGTGPGPGPGPGACPGADADGSRQAPEHQAALLLLLRRVRAVRVAPTPPSPPAGRAAELPAGPGGGGGGGPPALAQLPLPLPLPLPLRLPPFAALRQLELVGLDLRPAAFCAAALRPLRPTLEALSVRRCVLPAALAGWLACGAGASGGGPAAGAAGEDATGSLDPDGGVTWLRLTAAAFVGCEATDALFAPAEPSPPAAPAAPAPLALLSSAFAALAAATSLDLSVNLLTELPACCGGASADVAAGCVRLRHLDLSFNLVTAVLHAGPLLAGITRLSLRGNAIRSTAGLEDLAASLIELDLSACLIADWAEVRRLATLPRLQKLALAENPIAWAEGYRPAALACFFAAARRRRPGSSGRGLDGGAGAGAGGRGRRGGGGRGGGGGSGPFDGPRVAAAAAVAAAFGSPAGPGAGGRWPELLLLQLDGRAATDAELARALALVAGARWAGGGAAQPQPQPQPQSSPRPPGPPRGDKPGADVEGAPVRRDPAAPSPSTPARVSRSASCVAFQVGGAFEGFGGPDPSSGSGSGGSGGSSGSSGRSPAESPPSPAGGRGGASDSPFWRRLSPQEGAIAEGASWGRGGGGCGGGGGGGGSGGGRSRRASVDGPGRRRVRVALIDEEEGSSSGIAGDGLRPPAGGDPRPAVRARRRAGPALRHAASLDSVHAPGRGAVAALAALIRGARPGPPAAGVGRSGSDSEGGSGSEGGSSAGAHACRGGCCHIGASSASDAGPDSDADDPEGEEDEEQFWLTSGGIQGRGGARRPRPSKLPPIAAGVLLREGYWSAGGSPRRPPPGAAAATALGS